MTTATTYPYPFLMDAPEDFFIEEHAWVAGDLATTPEEAVAVLEREWQEITGGPVFEHDDMYPTVALRCVGKEWMVAAFTVYDDETDEPTELRGADAEREGGNDEYLRFVACPEGTEAAREWWKVERVELCGKWIEPDEVEQCLRDPGHDGPCVSNQDKRP